MMGRIERTQALLDHVRIDLGSGDIDMAQHVLQRPEIRASFQQVRRKGMPQRVRAEGFMDRRLVHIFLDDFP
jgi:hypothetical protein